MRKPQLGDIVHCYTKRGDGNLAFYQIVERVWEEDDTVMFEGPCSNGSPPWNNEGADTYFDPGEDGDYVITDPAEYDRIWAEFAAARLTGE